jgi:hypothetical protein
MRVALKTTTTPPDRDARQRQFLALGSRVSLYDSPLRIDFAPLAASFYTAAFSQCLELMGSDSPALQIDGLHYLSAVASPDFFGQMRDDHFRLLHELILSEGSVVTDSDSAKRVVDVAISAVHIILKQCPAAPPVLVDFEIDLALSRRLPIADVPEVLAEFGRRHPPMWDHLKDAGFCRYAVDLFQRFTSMLALSIVMARMLCLLFEADVFEPEEGCGCVRLLMQRFLVLHDQHWRRKEAAPVAKAIFRVFLAMRRPDFFGVLFEGDFLKLMIRNLTLQFEGVRSTIFSVVLRICELGEQFIRVLIENTNIVYMIEVFLRLGRERTPMPKWISLPLITNIISVMAESSADARLALVGSGITDMFLALLADQSQFEAKLAVIQFLVAFVPYVGTPQVSAMLGQFDVSCLVVDVLQSDSPHSAMVLCYSVLQRLDTDCEFCARLVEEMRLVDFKQVIEGLVESEDADIARSATAIISLAEERFADK